MLYSKPFNPTAFAKRFINRYGITVNEKVEATFTKKSPFKNGTKVTSNKYFYDFSFTVYVHDDLTAPFGLHFTNVEIIKNEGK